MAEHSTDATVALWHRVADILSSDHFRTTASIYDRRSLIRRANACGGPTMELLHWRKLAELQRLPHSDEGETVDAIAGIDRFGAEDVEVFMVSHRWLRPSLDRTLSHADGLGNEKAKVLNEFSKWRREWVQHRHGFLPEIYYWIDYCCIDQARPADAVPLLPLWVACCERFLRIETPDYDERAWCRLEPLLSYVFSFADHHISIGLDFQSRWPDSGAEVSRVVFDPRTGKHTDPEDMKRIEPLVNLAIELQPANRSHGPAELGKSAVKCFAF